MTRIIFGMLAVAVLSPVNVDQVIPDSYYLTLGAKHVLPINEWWGKRDEFALLAATYSIPSVTLDFSEMMEAL